MTEPRTFTGDWDDDDLDVAIATGQADIDRFEVVEDERRDRQDKVAEIASLPFYSAQPEQPADSARRPDERAVRSNSGQVEVRGASTRCSCGAREIGYPHPGHRYSCPRYSKNPLRDAA